MNIKLADLKNMETNLTALLNKELNIKVAYKLGKFAKQISQEFKELEENRMKLIRKYGIENKEKNIIEVPLEKTNDFSNEYGILLMEEVSIDFKPILLEEFGDIKLSASDMMFFRGFIIEDVAEQTEVK
jgi:hypothetical protein